MTLTAAITATRKALGPVNVRRFGVGRGFWVTGDRDPGAAAELLRWTLPHQCDVSLLGRRILVTVH